MVDLFSNQLRQRQNRFTIKLIHYNLIHYSHFNCIGSYCVYLKPSMEARGDGLD